MSPLHRVHELRGQDDLAAARAAVMAARPGDASHEVRWVPVDGLDAVDVDAGTVRMVQAAVAALDALSP